MLILVGSAVLTAVAILLLLKTPVGRYFLDSTDKAHAMHAQPVPRVGGLAIAVVSTFAFLASTPDAGANLVGRALPAAFAMALFSLVDDKRGLPAWMRLIVQFAAAAFLTLAVANAGTSQATIFHAVWGLVLLAVATVWLTNLYNFMDGANGFAGWMGFIGFGALAFASHVTVPQGTHDLAIFCTAISGACAGFLLFNFPRASIFMGDVGSIYLGFGAAAAGIIGAAVGAWPLWLPVLFFSPFIVDATVTLMRRVVRGERIWQAHRQHVYQRLIISCGWSHARAALTYATLMLLAAAHGNWWLSQKTALVDVSAVMPPIPMFLPWVLTYTALLAVAEWHIRRQPLTKTMMSAKEDQGFR